jgi:L-threonylcarbamoyladenylate synthase
VFGLGCDPAHDKAVRRILALKGRPRTAGLILIASDPAQLEGWIVPTAAERRRLASKPCKPVTWVVTAGPRASTLITGGRDTIAVRITKHPVAAALCARSGMPLVSTSANRHGRPPARSALAVRRAFNRKVDYVVPGATGGLARPTEIREARTGKVLREG